MGLLSYEGVKLTNIFVHTPSYWELYPTNLRGPLTPQNSRANSQKLATHTSTKRSRIGVRLQRVEARIEAGRRDKSLVCPPLDDAAALEHNDLVGRSHRRETVRHLLITNCFEASREARGRTAVRHRQHRAAAREQGERVMHLIADNLGYSRVGHNNRLAGASRTARSDSASRLAVA